MTVACPLGISRSHVLVTEPYASTPAHPCVPCLRLDLLRIDRSLLSNILAWPADCSNVAAAACAMLTFHPYSEHSYHTYMSVAKYVSFQAEIKLFDCFPAIVGDVDIHKNSATADPNLPMQSCCHLR